MSAITHATKENFKKLALTSKQPVLVDFYATWCGPCKLLAPTLEKLAGEFAGQARILKVNVEEEPELAAFFRVNGVPTLILFKDGRIARTTVGLASPAELKRMITSALPAQPAASR